MESTSIHRPVAGAPVLLYDSPHSGRFYPSDFETAATGHVLRRGEDAYVDQLLLPAVDEGAVLVAANYPRCYIDLNRDPDDIDERVLASPWPGPVKVTERSAGGFGLVRRFVTPGVDLYARPLTVAEVRHRVTKVYEPYHRDLRALSDEMLLRLGFVWHLDWHSMASGVSPSARAVARPDVAVGTVNGYSASGELTDLVVSGLRDIGLRVVVNDPWIGGTITRRYADPASGRHVVHVELNRALYLDEASLAVHDGFITLQKGLTSLTRRLCDAARARPCIPPF